MTRIDGPGFSLCAALLNHLVLDFEVCDRGQMNEWKSGGMLDQSLSEGT